MYKIDLHTHSVASHDGGISMEQYKKALENNVLDFIAITDHNRIDLAQRIQQELGDRIIVGEEIMTTTGEIVGLYLTHPVAPHRSPKVTIKDIRAQGGIVYIPHPFETIRKGLHPEVLEEIAADVDIIEVCNGRAFAQNRSDQTVVWAKLNQKIGAASSDAHGYHGLGKTYTIINEAPTRENLLQVMANSIPKTDRPSFRSLMYPKYNKFIKKVRRDG